MAKVTVMRVKGKPAGDDPIAKALSGLLGGGPDDEAEPGEGSLEDEHLDDAFEAVRKGDREGFRDAFKAAVVACVRRELDEGGGEHEEPDSDDY